MNGQTTGHACTPEILERATPCGRPPARLAVVLVAVILMMLPSAPAVLAQQTKGAIRVQTNEVVVPVSVTDRPGDFVLDLGPEDFHVFEDGIEQKIDHCQLAENPLSVALVMETSSRVAALAPSIHSIGVVFTQTVMARDGEGALITYDSSPEVRQPFTENHNAMEKAITSADFGGSGAELYDAMAAAVKLLETRPANRRRILLVIGESDDSGSRATLADVLREAEAENIVIYGLGLSGTEAALKNGEIPPLKLAKRLPAISVASPPAQSVHGEEVPVFDWGSVAFLLLTIGKGKISSHQLEIAAAATGGAHYDARREATLQDAISRIGAELYEQYILTYRPSAPRPQGFHRIKVTVSRPGFTARFRSTYYAMPTGN